MERIENVAFFGGDVAAVSPTAVAATAAAAAFVVVVVVLQPFFLHFQVPDISPSFCFS